VVCCEWTAGCSFLLCDSDTDADCVAYRVGQQYMFLFIAFHMLHAHCDRIHALLELLLILLLASLSQSSCLALLLPLHDIVF